jgi:hypothetical protein
MDQPDNSDFSKWRKARPVDQIATVDNFLVADSFDQ